MSDVFDMKKPPNIEKGGKLITTIAIIFALFVIGSNALKTVGPGSRGVVFSKFGGIQDVVLDEGLHFIIPFIETIIPVDVRIQKAQTGATASSKDLQTVSSTIAVNYHINPDKVNVVYQEIGIYFKERVIDPAVQEAMKAATAQYTAEELITRREDVKDLIKVNLISRLSPFNIIVDEFNIIDFSFSKSFDMAIESKQTAEQQALKAKRDLERIKIEAEQMIARAKAESESQRIQRETISPIILQLRAIEKWDGKMPEVVGGAMPFIDAGNLKGGQLYKK